MEASGNARASPPLGKLQAVALLCTVAVAWGLTWPVNKEQLAYISPVWAVVARFAVATLILGPLTAARGRLTLPPRQDLPVVYSVGLLHMVAFSILCSLGLLHVAAGRSVLLAYTTPFWVFPLARIFLGERLTTARLLAFSFGIAGLLMLMNPLSLNWSDPHVVKGHGLILLAAILWAFSIIYVRKHRWVMTPFDLLFWQALLTGVVTAAVAFAIEGPPHVDVTWSLVLLALYGGGIGTALAFWAINTVNRVLPATTTSLGLLGVPLFGVASSMVTLGESIDATSIAALLLIVGGIAIATLGGRSGRSS